MFFNSLQEDNNKRKSNEINGELSDRCVKKKKCEENNITVSIYCDGSSLDNPGIYCNFFFINSIIRSFWMVFYSFFLKRQYS